MLREHYCGSVVDLLCSEVTEVLAKQFLSFLKQWIRKSFEVSDWFRMMWNGLETDSEIALIRSD